MDIKNKIAIVTGASSGIGETTARLLTKKGAKVVLAARNNKKLRSLEEELEGSVAVVTDMTKKIDIENMVKVTLEKYAGVDILINNAGRGYLSSVENMHLNDLGYIYNLNVFAPIIAMQQVIPVMRRRGGGVIVNISSGTVFMNIPNLGGYSSSKRALTAISLAASEELKKDKIIVSTVYPFVTKTDFGKNAIKPKGVDYSRGRDMPEGDSPEFVAEKILQAIEQEKQELQVHDFNRAEMGDNK